MQTAARPFRPADLLRQVLITDLDVSPDAAWVVYVRRTIEDGEYRSRLWRVPFAGGRPEQLTTGDADFRPRFAPDGATLLFLSTRSGTPQPWLLSLRGGEPRPLARLPGPATAADWSPDGRRVLVLARNGVRRFAHGDDADAPVARRIGALTWRLDGLGVRDEFSSAYVVRAAGGRPARVTEPRYEVVSAFWPGDDRRIGFLADLRPEAQLLEYPQAWSLPTAGGRPRPLAELLGSITAAASSPGGHIAVVGVDEPRSPGWANAGLFVVEGRSVRRLGAELEGPVGIRCFDDLAIAGLAAPSLAWLDDDSVAALVTHRGSILPYRFAVDGPAERLVDGDHTCSALATGAGRVAVLAAERGRPPEVCAVELGRLRPLTRDGSRWFRRFRRDPVRFAVAHPDGHEIDTWLVPAPARTRRRRLVLHVRGGPHLANSSVPWSEMLALADAGISVLYTNPRGSVGYGEPFARAIDGSWGDADSSDLLRAVDWAVEEGIADPRLVGVLGLSYGGYMVNWLLGRYPGRFAAAVSENPVTDLFSFYGESDLGPWIWRVAAGVDGPADGLVERLRDRSPATWIHHNEAPLLLLQAEQDLRCPPGQSELPFAILRTLGRPVELVRYPDESHLLLCSGRPDRRVDRLERIVDWFDRHLR